VQKTNKTKQKKVGTTEQLTKKIFPFSFFFSQQPKNEKKKHRKIVISK